MSLAPRYDDRGVRILSGQRMDPSFEVVGVLQTAVLEECSSFRALHTDLLLQSPADMPVHLCQQYSL